MILEIKERKRSQKNVSVKDAVQKLDVFEPDSLAVKAYLELSPGAKENFDHVFSP